MASCSLDDSSEWEDALPYGTSYTYSNGTTITIQKSYKYLAAHYITQYFAMVDLYGCDYIKLSYNNEEVKWKA